MTSLRTRPYPPFALLLLSLLLIFLVTTAAGEAQPVRDHSQLPHLSLPAQTYIVRLRQAETSRFLDEASQLLEKEVEPIFLYQHVFAGVALQLSGTELTVVRDLPSVSAIYPEQTHQLLSDAGPAWIGAPLLWNDSGGLQTQGEGVIVGVIDSGIDADHSSFATVGADGYSHQNPWGGYAGVCDPGSGQFDPNFACNDKLIGAWNYADGPEDNDGHGSHIAAIAAGNHLNASFVTANGFDYEAPLTGVAPHANIVVYDACSDVCQTSALLAAIDQAIADDIDVLNLAVSGGRFPYQDPVELALLSANSAGIFVAAAGGDRDRGNQHLSPWVTTAVAVTHHRRFGIKLTGLTSDSGSLADMAGVGVSVGTGPAPLVYAGDFGDPTCATPFAAETWTAGEIVVCETADPAFKLQGSYVLAGGAAGLILVGPATETGPLAIVEQPLPYIKVSFAVGELLRSWLANGAGHTATIEATETRFEAEYADQLLGTNPVEQSLSPALLKPDVVAPGSNILAAERSLLPISPPEFALRSGSSPASAHLAGAAALLSAAQPTWTPDEIRSALLMTAVSDGLRPASGGPTPGLFERGHGRLQVAEAARSGLSLTETAANYLAAGDTGVGQLNIPSLVNDSCFQTCSWQRILRNTAGSSASWTVTAAGSSGLALSVSPQSFTVVANGWQTITVTADVTQLVTEGGLATGALLFSNGQTPELRLPVAVQRASATAPGSLEISGPQQARPGQRVDFAVRLDNLDSVSNTFSLTVTLPTGITFVPGSASGGLVYDDITHQMHWQGALEPGTRGYQASPLYPPLSYVNLADLSSQVENLCDLFANCDDVVVDISLAPEQVTFYDDPLSELGVSSNGLLLGPSADVEDHCHPCPQRLPQAEQLNDLIAGLWRDMDATGSGGAWYVGLLDGLLPGETVLYANWHDVGQWGDPLLTSRHAVAMPLNGEGESDGRIYFLYDDISDRARLRAHGFTMGLENGDGSAGVNLASAPCPDASCSHRSAQGELPPDGWTWQLNSDIVGGNSARVFTFQGTVTSETGAVLTSFAEAAGSGTISPMMAVTSVEVTYRQQLPIVAK